MELINSKQQYLEKFKKIRPASLNHSELESNHLEESKKSAIDKESLTIAKRSNSNLNYPNPWRQGDKIEMLKPNISSMIYPIFKSIDETSPSSIDFINFRTNSYHWERKYSMELDSKEMANICSEVSRFDENIEDNVQSSFISTTRPCLDQENKYTSYETEDPFLLDLNRNEMEKSQMLRNSYLTKLIYYNVWRLKLEKM